MIVTILGGSSMSTPALLMATAPSHGIDFRLAGRSRSGLEGNCRAAKLLNPECPVTVHQCDPETSREVLRGSNVVIIQMRVGGFPGRSFDETFSLPSGIVGDEGLGPGGLSAAWRTWPVLHPWLLAIRTHAPDALVLMVSSPLGILTRATAACFPELECYGICEVPTISLREICSAAGARLQSTTFEYLGVNHIGWLYHVKESATDLLAAFAASRDPSEFPQSAIIHSHCAIPTKYLRLHFQREEVLREQRSAGQIRAQELQQLQDESRTVYASGSAAQIRAALKRRRTPWYSDAIGPFLEALCSRDSDSDTPFFLTVRNGTWSRQFASDEVLEIPFYIRDRTPVAKPVHGTAPPKVTAMISDFCRYERAATKAVLSRSPRLLLAAVTLHPWTPPSGEVAELLCQSITNWKP